MCTSNSLIDFWSSPEVARHVKEAVGHSQPIGFGEEETPTWRLLQSEIIRLNTKLDYRIPPPLVSPHTYCEDQVPFRRDDGSNDYLSFRRCFGVWQTYSHCSAGKSKWQVEASTSRKRRLNSRTIPRAACSLNSSAKFQRPLALKRWTA